MNHAIALSLANETVHLLADRALWWPRGETVFIADPHFGKAATFRLSGIPVPESAHHADLQRLSRILQAAQAAHLIILGDFLHARKGNNPATLSALQQWRDEWLKLRITLVIGNHDRHAGRPVEPLHIDCVEEPYPCGPFSACHHPDIKADGVILAGHLHPGVRIESHSAPCFYLTPGRLILPAFGSFTGICAVRPGAGERMFIADRGEIVELPQRL